MTVKLTGVHPSVFHRHSIIIIIIIVIVRTRAIFTR